MNPTPFEDEYPTAAAVLQTIYEHNYVLAMHFDRYGGWSRSKITGRLGVLKSRK